MQKSLIWKGFLSESMWVEGYGDLSSCKKLVFWVSYPFSYARFEYDVVWDHIDRVYCIFSRARSTKKGSDPKNLNFSKYNIFRG